MSPHKATSIKERSKNLTTILKKLILMLSLALPMSQANALMLDNWNDTDLDASGDYVDVTFDPSSDNWFSLQWVAGAGNELQALGIDTVFYNSSVTVSSVYTGATVGDMATNVTSDWNLNFGGTTGGGGFGSFASRKNLEGGGTDGINNFITFLLDDGSALPFTANSNGATMDVHVRYEENCSGWASDGTSNDPSTGSCRSVPEPMPLVLISLGLVVLGFGRKIRSALHT